jgi:hypothetical protein
MRKLIAAAAVVLSFGLAMASAADFDGFRNVTDVSVMKPFARDLGGLLGSGTNQTARPLGFSGFDFGVRAVAQFNPSHGDTVLKTDNTFGLGFVQAEIGMPYRIDGFVRGGSFEGLTVAGGGLRYGLWNVSDEKYKINAMLVGMADMATNPYFYAVHFNTSVLFSINVPVLAPFFGAGYDFTRLQSEVAALSNKSVSVSDPRFQAGLRLKLGLGYFAAGETYTHDRLLTNASAGFRF